VVRDALQALPWVRKAEIDFDNKLARVTVVTKSYDADALVAALKAVGFGGKPTTKVENKADKTGPLVTFHVKGMKKTKSGAT
jgi:copper chaperone CopZ